MNTFVRLMVLGALLATTACGKSEKERPRRPVLPVPQIQNPAPSATPAQAKATPEQEALAAKKVEADAFAQCCTSLAKRGFEDRSMEYMAASRSCEAAVRDGKQLADVSSDLLKELKDKALPGSCKAN